MSSSFIVASHLQLLLQTHIYSIVYNLLRRTPIIYRIYLQHLCITALQVLRGGLRARDERAGGELHGRRRGRRGAQRPLLFHAGDRALARQAQLCRGRGPDWRGFPGLCGAGQGAATNHRYFMRVLRKVASPSLNPTLAADALDDEEIACRPHFPYKCGPFLVCHSNIEHH